MQDGENAFAETPQAARILEERFGEIFSDYERRLGAMGSLLIVGEGTTREQLESNAREHPHARRAGPPQRGGVTSGGRGGDIPQHRGRRGAPQSASGRVVSGRGGAVQGGGHGSSQEPAPRDLPGSGGGDLPGSPGDSDGPGLPDGNGFLRGLPAHQGQGDPVRGTPPVLPRAARPSSPTR